MLNPRAARGEINHQPSLTIPDEALSITEIFQRYARGLGIDGMRQPLYSEDPETDLPDPRRLDLAEREEYMERYAVELDELRKKEAAYQASLKKKQSKKEVEDLEHEDVPGNQDEPKPKDKKPGQGKKPKAPADDQE